MCGQHKARNLHELKHTTFVYLCVLSSQRPNSCRTYMQLSTIVTVYMQCRSLVHAVLLHVMESLSYLYFAE